MADLKPISFVGAALDDLREFPQAARRETGYQLNRVQNGLDPDDWKPMKLIGKGVREIRSGTQTVRSGSFMWRTSPMLSMCCTVPEDDAKDQ